MVQRSKSSPVSYDIALRILFNAFAHLITSYSKINEYLIQHMVLEVEIFVVLTNNDILA